jgi:RimJ/RimL family protein N-acetyltransferase
VTLAAGYSLISWTGAVPEDRLDQVAGINAMLADAPRDASWQAEVWNAERVRSADRRITGQGLRYYSMAALADSGEMAALSQLGADPERPGWGFQELTAVAREHRGHGLGLAVKLAMLAWLSSAEPGIQQIMTWNAEQNGHMIAINETLGATVLGVPMRSWEWELG